MTPLPIDASLSSIIEASRERSLVLVAPPGSGKTTRVPPAIRDSGLLPPDYPTVIVLQPRRIAARAAAARVADERGWRLGQQVGYQVRFEKRWGPQTHLRFLTEGILTRQLLSDPFLEGVGAVVLDEFHERSLNTDLALALVNDIRQQVRPDLIVVVMSATVDAEPVARFLGDCPIITVEGRTFPVSTEYRPRSRPASVESVAPIVQELLEEPPRGHPAPGDSAQGYDGAGHILVFLPGLAEIRRLARKLEPIAARCGAVVLPLHGSLPADEQDRALQPSDRRKVILSTNVAETSVTIDGVAVVVDSGLARSVHYDSQRGIDRWELARISQAAALQRAGRAGRTGPGRCIRLWSTRAERGLAPFEPPEIHRVDLCTAVLGLHAWGVTEPGQFRWFDAPAPERLIDAERLLLAMGALSAAEHHITPVGQDMIKWPIHPRLARLLIAAVDAGRPVEGATIAALLSEKDIKIRDSAPPRAKPAASARNVEASGPSDILVRVDLLAEAEAHRFAPSLRARGIDPVAARQVVRLRDDLMRLTPRKRAAPTIAGGPRDDQDEDVLKWVLLAYPDRVVKRRGAPGTGVMVGGRGVRLGPESVVRDAELFVAIDAREERRGGLLEVQVNLTSTVEAEWLEELFPHHIRRERVLRYDASRLRVVGSLRVYYHDLLLRDDATASVDPAQAASILAEALRPEAAAIFRSSAQAASWLARYDFVRRAVPELSWPEFDDEVLAHLLVPICQGKSERAEVEKADFVAALESRLHTRLIREMLESAPETLAIPSGRRVRLAYEPGRPPILAVRLQELFGWTETPRVAKGRVPVQLHLLGPNHRPVQITTDLRSFWSTTYQQVRKDLRARYPKHAWPEDPFQARAAKPDRR
jgi:ATP-dependent helicase HrpB